MTLTQYNTVAIIDNEDYQIDNTQIYTESELAFIRHKSFKTAYMLCEANTYESLIKKAKKLGAIIIEDLK